MSIIAEPSLFQNEVQTFNAKLCKWLFGSGGDNVLRFDIADLSDHCPVISLQTLGGLALSYIILTPFNPTFI